MSAGYSGTPLHKKLGIPSEGPILIVNAPDSLWEMIAPLPDGTETEVTDALKDLAFVHGFYLDAARFKAQFPDLKRLIAQNGTLWISWPKKSSGVKTDLNENVIRDFGLENGLVDVKVCAIDDIWSGLKFMYRVKDRK